MLKLLCKYKWYIVVLLSLIIIEPILNSILNFWLQNLFNSAVPDAEKLMILRLITVGFLLWILKRIACFASGIIKAQFICNAKQDIKHRMFIGIFDLDISNITGIASSGEYISVFTNDIAMLESRFYNQIVGLISSIFSIIILGTSFIALNRKLAFAILGFGIISMLVPVIFSKMLNANSLKYSETISHFTQKLKEYITAFPTIKNYSIENSIIERFSIFNKQTEDVKFEADYMLTLANNVGQLLAWFMQFIGVGIGIVLVIKGEIMIGTVIAAQSFANDLALPLQNLIININSIRSVKEIVRKIEILSIGINTDTWDSVKFVTADALCTMSNKDGYNLIFDKMNLRIGSKQIINDFTYCFEHKKKYLIVGLNGAGKSSIFKTLKKWYPISSGDIYLGDKNIREMSNKEISYIVSYLNESVSLFSGTAKENITLFREVSDEALNIVKNDAQICIELEREISDEGRNISSGEQRRIEIARSLLNSVSILIFDEVISTLDIETAYEIERMALRMKDQTVIFISHNFSGKLIKEYDDILVIDGGRLIAHGRYDDLIESCEYFRRICEIKFGI